MYLSSFARLLMPTHMWVNGKAKTDNAFAIVTYLSVFHLILNDKVKGKYVFS